MEEKGQSHKKVSQHC